MDDEPLKNIYIIKSEIEIFAWLAAGIRSFIIFRVSLVAL
jgi:hypothetical protein